MERKTATIVLHPVIHPITSQPHIQNHSGPGHTRPSPTVYTLRLAATGSRRVSHHAPLAPSFSAASCRIELKSTSGSWKTGIERAARRVSKRAWGALAM